MEQENIQNIEPQIKLALYYLANKYLNEGKSHPQVLEALLETDMVKEVEAPEKLLNLLIEKATVDAWEKLEEFVRTGMAAGRPMYSIKEELYVMEEDKEVADYIADTFYHIKTIEINEAAEGREMQTEGGTGMLKYGAGAALLFFISSNLYLKWLWAAIFAGSLILFISGWLKSRRAKKINQIFNHESDSESV